MKNIINQTENIAYVYLKNFGFTEEQISVLITQGKKDLHKELEKLESLLSGDIGSLKDINNVLHALKGLLFQLGNHEVAEQLNEIRENHNSKLRFNEISKLLFDIK